MTLGMTGTAVPATVSAIVTYSDGTKVTVPFADTNMVFTIEPEYMTYSYEIQYSVIDETAGRIYTFPVHFDSFLDQLMAEYNTYSVDEKAAVKNLVKAAYFGNKSGDYTTYFAAVDIVDAAALEAEANGIFKAADLAATQRNIATPAFNTAKAEWRGGSSGNEKGVIGYRAEFKNGLAVTYRFKYDAAIVSGAKKLHVLYNDGTEKQDKELTFGTSTEAGGVTFEVKAVGTDEIDVVISGINTANEMNTVYAVYTENDSYYSYLGYSVRYMISKAGTSYDEAVANYYVSLAKN